MKISILRYILTLANESIGAYELVPRNKRYLKLSQSLKVMSNYMTDRQILSFYTDRSVIYKQIKVFTGFFISFLIFMSYILTGYWLFALSIALILLVMYGFIAVFVKAERKYSDLWDDRELFSNFIKLNQSAVFDPESFDVIVKADDESAMVEEKLSFEDECHLLSKQENKFNKMDMQAVVNFFKITVTDDRFPKELQKVTIQPEDFIRFIKTRFIDNSNEALQITLISGDKSHVKALFHCFYTFSCEFYGEKKKSQAKRYSDLYLNSFDLFDKVDYSNFSDALALDYSNSIKDFFKIKKGLSTSTVTITE